MSKIDDYKLIKKIANSVKTNLYRATKRDKEGNIDSSNDKGQIYIKYTGNHVSDWNSAVLHIHASYGYYGFSSVYSAMDTDTASYLEKAINIHMKDIVNTVFKLVETDVEQARTNAEEEAREVLKITTKEC